MKWADKRCWTHCVCIVNYCADPRKLWKWTRLGQLELMLLLLGISLIFIVTSLWFFSNVHVFKIFHFESCNSKMAEKKQMLLLNTVFSENFSSLKLKRNVHIVIHILLQDSCRSHLLANLVNKRDARSELFLNIWFFRLSKLNHFLANNHLAWRLFKKESLGECWPTRID